MDKVIITVVGTDQPGILAATSGILLEQGCNIENLSQTLLQDVFGALILVSRPASISNQSLQEKLTKHLEKWNLDVNVKDHATQDSITHPPSDSFIITTLGPDSEGLVEAVTSVLQHYNVNVTNLSAVFKGGDAAIDNVMIFEVDVPVTVELQELKSSLANATEKLGLDFSMQHKKIFETMNRI